MNTQQYFLEDDQVCLRPLLEADISGNYQHWFNDPAVVQFNSHGRFPMTVEQLMAYVRSSSQTNTLLVLAVLDKGTNQHVGNISLQHINWIDRGAEIAFVLGEKEWWGKGVMFRAGSLLIAHAFNTLNLKRIGCGTLATNTGMQRLAGKLGFQQEGIRRQAVFKNGDYIDVIEYGLLKQDISVATRRDDAP